MKAQENRALGDAGAGTARVNLGGQAPEERLLLSFGDVVALSGDFFVADGFPVAAARGYHRGFLENLSADPKGAVSASVGDLQPLPEAPAPRRLAWLPS